MVRRLKPINELSSEAKRTRERYRKNPESHEKYKQWLKDYNVKYKERHRIRKKLKGKEQREVVIKKLGSKCASCGEFYNPHHTRRDKLEIDHKFYLERGTRVTGTNTVLQIFRLLEQGVDPNTQFTLLCHSCHMIVTHIRKYPEKADSVLEYLRHLK